MFGKGAGRGEGGWVGVWGVGEGGFRGEGGKRRDATAVSCVG